MISIIVSVYNLSPYIKRCVDSLTGQTYKDIEIILVDDGSTDDSGQVCDQLAKEDDRIVVVHKENGGNASARNKGIDVAKGDYIIFSDADDYIEPNMCEVLLDKITATNTSIATGGAIVTTIDGNQKIVSVDSEIVYSREEAMHEFFARTGNILPSACGKLFKREVFGDTNRFRNGVIHEDTDAMPRFLDACDGVVVTPIPVWDYIKRENSASTSKHFNMRGYKILDALPGYRKMCKQKYPKEIAVFDYYALETTYEMLLNLWSCVDYNDYKKQERTLKIQIVKGIIRCVLYSTVRKEHFNDMKNQLYKVVKGPNLTA